jgi:hypothetical protein
MTLADVVKHLVAIEVLFQPMQPVSDRLSGMEVTMVEQGNNRRH